MIYLTVTRIVIQSGDQTLS